jgi:hypothetical protein
VLIPAVAARVSQRVTSTAIHISSDKGRRKGSV